MKNDDRLTFDQWFQSAGYSPEHRDVFREVWNAALTNAAPDLPVEWDPYEWLANRLKDIEPKANEG